MLAAHQRRRGQPGGDPLDALDGCRGIRLIEVPVVSADLTQDGDVDTGCREFARVRLPGGSQAVELRVGV